MSKTLIAILLLWLFILGLMLLLYGNNKINFAQIDAHFIGESHPYVVESLKKGNLMMTSGVLCFLAMMILLIMKAVQLCR